MRPFQPAPIPPSAQPEPPQLDDGFSPPAASSQAQKEPEPVPGEPVDPALWAKSDF
jgi:hypothetical protein